MYKGTLYGTISGYFSRNMQARKEWDDILKVLGKKKMLTKNTPSGRIIKGDRVFQINKI